MQNAGLRYLLIRGALAKFRQIRRRFSGPKGAFLALGIGFLLVIVIVPQMIQYVINRDSPRLLSIESNVREWVPGALFLGILLLGVSRGALYFRPAEVHFLFAAPIGRRQLLLYNVISRLRLQLLSALWFTIFIAPYAQLWYAAFFAAFLGLAFLQMTAQSGGLLMAAIGERLVRPVRFALLGGIAVAAIGSYFAMRASLAGEATGAEILAAIFDHPIMQTVSWITRPFVEVFLAASPLELLKWITVGVAILGVELALMLVLDVAYVEGAMAQGRRVQAAMKRMRSGGGAFAAYGSTRAGFRLPTFPYLGGIGPIAWRQCQEMTRNIRGVLMMGFTMFLWLGVLLVVPTVRGGGFDDMDDKVVQMALVMSLFMTSMLTINFPFDFRRDLDRMAYLKSIPVPSPAIAAGQIVPTAFLLLFWQSIALVVLTASTGRIGTEQFLAMLFLLPLLNWAVAAIDNGTFLLLPYRIAVRDPGNLPFMGRLMLVMALKMIVLMVVVGVAAGAAALVWFFVLPSWLLAGLAAAAVLLAADIPLTLYVAAAWEKFDIATDIPE